MITRKRYNRQRQAQEEVVRIIKNLLKQIGPTGKKIYQREKSKKGD